MLYFHVESFSPLLWGFMCFISKTLCTMPVFNTTMAFRWSWVVRWGVVWVILGGSKGHDSVLFSTMWQTRETAPIITECSEMAHRVSSGHHHIDSLTCHLSALQQIIYRFCDLHSSAELAERLKTESHMASEGRRVWKQQREGRNNTKTIWVFQLNLAASKSRALKPHWLLEIASILQVRYTYKYWCGGEGFKESLGKDSLNMRNLTNLMMILLRPFCESNKTIWTGISGFEFKTASRSNACDGLRLGQTTVASCSERSFFFRIY